MKQNLPTDITFKTTGGEKTILVSDIIGMSFTEEKPNQLSCKIITVNGLFVLGYSSLASPTALLTLCSVAGINAAGLTSPAELIEALKKSADLKAYTCGSSSLVVNTLIAYVYTGPAFKTFWHAISKLCGKEKVEKIKILSCFAIFCSLAFAQLARDSFDFTGTIASYLPFGINGLNYLVTRYVGMFEYLKEKDEEWFNKNNKFRMTILNHVLHTKDKDPNNKLYVEVKNGDVNAALIDFLKLMFDDKNKKVPEHFVRNVARDRWDTFKEGAMWVISPLEFAWVAYVANPLFSAETIKGAGSLVGNIPTDPRVYNDPLFIALAMTAQIPTTLFYHRHLRNLPGNAAKVYLNTYTIISHIYNKNYPNEAHPTRHKAGQITLTLFKLLGWHLLMFMCLASGYSFTLTFKSMIDDGFFDYMALTHEDPTHEAVMVWMLFAQVAGVNMNVICRIFNTMVLKEPTPEFETLASLEEDKNKIVEVESDEEDQDAPKVPVIENAPMNHEKKGDEFKPVSLESEKPENGKNEEQKTEIKIDVKSNTYTPKIITLHNAAILLADHQHKLEDLLIKSLSDHPFLNKGCGPFFTGSKNDNNSASHTLQTVPQTEYGSNSSNGSQKELLDRSKKTVGHKDDDYDDKEQNQDENQNQDEEYSSTNSNNSKH